MKHSIWLSFEIGILGDYSSLYTWLDSKGAKECCSNLSYFNYDYNSDLVEELKEDLLKNVRFDKNDRVYAIVNKRNEEGVSKPVGKFIIGNRTTPPWLGFGNKGSEDNVDEG